MRSVQRMQKILLHKCEDPHRLNIGSILTNHRWDYCQTLREQKLLSTTEDRLGEFFQKNTETMNQSPLGRHVHLHAVIELVGSSTGGLLQLVPASRRGLLGMLASKKLRM